MWKSFLHSAAILPRGQRQGSPASLVEEGLEARCRLPSSGKLSSTAFTNISLLLGSLDLQQGRVGSERWCTRPRIYTILRNIHGLELMSHFISASFTDMSLPFDQYSIPGFVRHVGLDSNFLAIQYAVLTDMKAVETLGQHGHFEEEAGGCYESTKDLGRGGQGIVDVVQSRLSLDQFARKRIQRTDHASSRTLQRAIMEELQLLKAIKHRHLVTIIGSYTDPSYIAYLMTPIADFNLREFLSASERTGTDHPHVVSCRYFYGCLTGALEYLHSKKIRHRDLKPENILIKDRRLYIADFGSAINGALTGQVTTQHRNPPVTSFYMAPEYARATTRHMAADLWSLGVVFLEIATRLSGKKTKKFRSSLDAYAREHKQPSYPYSNPAFLSIWMDKLRDDKDDEDANRNNEPLNWTTRLLQTDPKDRISAKALLRDIMESPFCNDYCCVDCESEFHKILYGGNTQEHQDETEYRTEIATLLHNNEDETQLPLSLAKSENIMSWIIDTDSIKQEHGTKSNQQSQARHATNTQSGHTMFQAPVHTSGSSTAGSSSSRVSFHSATLEFDVEEDSSTDGNVKSSEELIELIFDTSGSEMSDHFVSRDETVGFEDFAALTDLTAIPEEDTILYYREDLDEPDDLITYSKAGIAEVCATSTELVKIDPVANRVLQMKRKVQHDRLIETSSNLNKRQLPDKDEKQAIDEFAQARKAVIEAGDGESSASHTQSRSRKGHGPKRLSPSIGTAGFGQVPNQSRTIQDQFDASSSCPKVKKTALIDPSEYINNAWSNMENIGSVGTSVMSTRTRQTLLKANVALLDRTVDLLYRYCSRGKVAAVRTILDRGVVAKGRRPPFQAAIKGATPQHIKCVRELIKHGADVNMVLSKGKTPLHMAIENWGSSHYNSLLGVLLVAGANVNHTDSKGQYPLLKLLMHGGNELLETYQVEACALFLNKNVPVTLNLDVVQEGTKDTALHLAIRRRSPVVVALLVHGGADVNAKDASGTTPLLRAAHQWPKRHADDKNPTFDIPKMTIEHELILEYLLRSEKTDVNVCGGTLGRSPLQHAVLTGSAKAVRMLVDRGADIKSVDKAGSSALQLAVKHRRQIGKVVFDEMKEFLQPD